MEVKSCTLVEGTIACFPDTPPLGGVRCLRELRMATEGRLQAVIAFVVQRPDAMASAAQQRHDPTFVQALREAISEGVKVHACLYDVEPPVVVLMRSIPVLDWEAIPKKYR